MARRFLRAYGPASERDLARWAGLPLRDARAGVERIAGELGRTRVDGELLLTAGGRRRSARSPVVRLLGAYDNYNLAYRSRGFALAAEHERRIVPGGGVVRPAVTVDGRIVGAWASKRSGDRLAVSIEPFSELEREWADAIEAEVADIGRFEGLSAALV
jgi:hypothetical protein